MFIKVRAFIRTSLVLTYKGHMKSGPEVIKLFSC